MKQIYLSALIGLSVTATCTGQTLFGVQGSFQSSNIAVNVPAGAAGGLGFDYGSMFKSVTGFRAGLMADIPITGQLSVRPQLLYSTKGVKLDPREIISSLLGGLGGGSVPASALPDSLVQTARVNYLELPIQLMYGIDAGPGRLVAGGGPYVAYALSGSLNGQSVAFETGSKRFDYGANLSLGYELPSGISLSAYYSYGLANQSANDSTPPDPNDPNSVPVTISGTSYNRSFGFSLGYFFGTGN